MVLKKLFIFIPIIFLLAIAGCSKKNKNSFSLSGKINGLSNASILLLKAENLQEKSTILIDTITTNLKGEFNSVYFLEPDIYYLKYNDNLINLAIDKGQSIVIKGSDLNTLKINGSKDTKLLEEYENFRLKSLKKWVVSVRDSIKNLPKNSENSIKLRQLEVKNYAIHLNELLEFVKNKMGTTIGVYYSSIRWTGNENLEFLQNLVTAFEVQHPNITITEKLKQRLELLKKTSVGNTLPILKIPNTNGELIDLNSVREKFTLIDFWASWCPPCRTESVLLNKLYNTYNSKGFQIYGISLDTKHASWIKAIENDNRSWINVSTLQGFKTPVSTELGITALPFNILIDSSGKIVAANIFGYELEVKISELFAN